MKRALCLLLICLFCTGCSALPPEERAFCVALLVDGGAQECTVRVRIPTYQQNGGYQTLSASGTTLTDALRTLESAAPMRLHWGQLRLIVLSRAWAAEIPIVRTLSDLSGVENLRLHASVAVTEEDTTALAEKLVPVMSVLYIIFALVVIFGHAGNIGPAFGKIFATAFTPKALGGAASGIALKQTIVWGLRRSAFSNEAGLGSAAIAHAAADTKSPVQQGLYGIFEVFADTIVICTLTALTIICSGVDITFGHKVGSELITAAFATMFGQKFASVFVALALMLFAFTTILGWSLYGSRCVQYLFGLKVAKGYQVLFIIIVVVGAVASLDVVWDIADTFNGLMAIPNFVGLFVLSGVVAKLTKEHFSDPAAMLEDEIYT